MIIIGAPKFSHKKSKPSKKKLGIETCVHTESPNISLGQLYRIAFQSLEPIYKINIASFSTMIDYDFMLCACSDPLI